MSLIINAMGYSLIQPPKQNNTYDDRVAVWPSRDPIEENGGVNLYAFVGNNSIDKWDSMGLRGAPNGNKTRSFKVTVTDPKDPKKKRTKLHKVKYFFQHVVDAKSCKVSVSVPVRFVTASQTGMSSAQKAEVRRMINQGKGKLLQEVNAGIAKAWNNKFKFCCNCVDCPKGYEIDIKVNYKAKGNAWVVGLAKADRRVNSTQLMWNYAQGIGSVAAHEVGHMLGNPDEYLGVFQLGGGGNRDFTQDKASVMNNQYGQARKRHFSTLSKHLKKSGCKLVPAGQECPKK